MKQFLFILLILFSVDLTGQDCTEIYLIRHAEKDRSDLKNKNPHLNKLGKDRALKWVEVFKNVQFDKIFSTNYNRTTETVKPISLDKKLKSPYTHPQKIDYENFKSKTYGEKVLVVGHSNTIPFFVNGLIDNEVYQQIDDLNNANLYKVTICNDNITHSLLYIN